jgi:hypothetical protein
MVKEKLLVDLVGNIYNFSKEQRKILCSFNLQNF